MVCFTGFDKDRARSGTFVFFNAPVKAVLRTLKGNTEDK
jgi:hypothetical protein